MADVETHKPLTSERAVVIITANNRDGDLEHYKTKAALGIGLTQVLLGILAIILQSVATALNGRYHILAGYINPGIWCGAFFIITGLFGICSARCKTRCLIGTAMILYIISASIFTFALAFFTGVGIDQSHRILLRERSYRDHFHEDVNDQISDERIYRDHFHEDVNDQISDVEKLYGLYIALMTITVLQLVIAISASILSCKVLCCGKSAGATTIQYFPDPATSQQQVIVIGANGQVIPKSNDNPGHMTLLDESGVLERSVRYSASDSACKPASARATTGKEENTTDFKYMPLE